MRCSKLTRPTADVWRRTRGLALTAIVAALGLAALAVVTGNAYAGLPPAWPSAPQATTAPAVGSPHGAAPACAACHRTHTAAGAPLLAAAEADSSICTRCHRVGGADPVSTHSNVDYLGALQMPFYVPCTACHDPHGNPDGAGNKAMIRPVVGGLAVNFVASTGPGSFDDGMNNGLHDSICVVCHTTTSHNSVTSPELMGQGHLPVGGDCTACHAHGRDPASRSGFMPPPATATATPTGTGTPAPSATPTGTGTPAPSATPMSTSTPAPTVTPAGTGTPAPTPMPSPTAAAPTAPPLVPPPTDTAVPPA
ncbi:MAG: hypothetical protein KGK07_05095 [Chloroflexota bacterium]|nr:hypothetical protein [Chloroflexota bacterium]